MAQGPLLTEALGFGIHFCVKPLKNKKQTILQTMNNSVRKWMDG